MGLFEAMEAIPAVLVIASAVAGLCVGSFLNVVIHRLPLMMEKAWRSECAELEGREAPPPEVFNLVTPRSRCPKCAAPITAMQNIPIASWLWLGGKCANCKTPISARYPLVEAAAGILAALLAVRFGYSIALAVALLYAWALLALTMIDL